MTKQFILRPLCVGIRISHDYLVNLQNLQRIKVTIILNYLSILAFFPKSRLKSTDQKKNGSLDAQNTCFWSFKKFGFHQLFWVPDPKIRVFLHAANTRLEIPDAIKCPTRPDLTRSVRVRSGFLFGSDTRFPTLVHI